MAEYGATIFGDATNTLVCNVCDKNPAFGVCNCSFGAMSMAYCVECFKLQAEPEFGLQYLADMCNGDLSGLHESVKAIHTYKDGKYISIEEWIKDWKPTDYQGMEPNDPKMLTDDDF